MSKPLEPTYTCTAVGEATKGMVYNENLYPKASIKQQVTFLWESVKRLESQAFTLDSKPFHFIEEYQGQLTSIYFKDGSFLYACESFETLNTLFIAYNSHYPKFTSSFPAN